MKKGELLHALQSMSDDAEVVLDLTGVEGAARGLLADNDAVWTDFSVRTSEETHQINGAEGMIWLGATHVVMG